MDSNDLTIVIVTFNSELKIGYEFKTIEHIEDDLNSITLLLQTRF